ncbi:MAG: hypothetical protein EOM05_00390 [Clostridia bacterium]|nr:hypothetical protein [Clostridia bacterium]
MFKFKRNELKNNKFKILSVVSSICIVFLLIPFVFPVKAVDNNQGESEHMKYWTNISSAYNIQGQHNGEWKITTCGDQGFRATIIIDGLEHTLSQMQNGVAKVIDSDISVTLNVSIINAGRYVKIEYVVQNTSEFSHLISLGSGADVQIKNNDYAPITKFDDGSGFKMVEGDENSAQFNFIGKNAYGVTDVDTFWYGYWQNVETNMFTQITEDSYSGDSGMAYSWKDRTIPANSTQKYSVLIGIGAVNAAPVVTISNPAETFGACVAGGTYAVTGSVSDVENTVGTQLFYSIDGNDAVLAHTFAGQPGAFTANVNIPSDCQDGAHSIVFFAQDCDGAVSSVTTRTFTVQQSYTVSFNSNGGSAVGNITNVLGGQKVASPIAPTKSGYTFVGWFKDSSLTNAWNFSQDEVTNNTILYSKWEALTFTVKEAPKEIKNPELISMVPEEGAFNKSVEIRLKQDDVVREAFKEILKDKSDNTVIFPLDISVYIKDTDTKIQPEEGKSVKIIFPISEELLPYKDRIKVACILDGKINVLETKIVQVNGIYCVEFIATHFSPYAILVDDIVSVPNTSDNTKLISSSVLAVFSAATVIGINKKRKQD